jgi:homoserine dehydrogenase
LIPDEELIANVNGVKNAVWYKHMLSAQPVLWCRCRRRPNGFCSCCRCVDIVRDISYTEDGAGTIPQLAFEALTMCQF